jgi:5-methylcytosine-specific restriction endonuclease McrA
MADLRSRGPRRRLDPDSYHKLRAEVLRRDGWRCQTCGRPDRLQVHHIRSRGRLGDDADENLITLCADCHSDIHRTCAVNDGSGTVLIIRWS